MRLLYTIIFSFMAFLSFGQAKKGQYQYTVDLTQVKDDKLFVELKTPGITSDEIMFYLPKIIPGTYSIADIALFAYTHVAVDGGFDLGRFPAINAWIERVRAQPRFVTIA